MSESIVTFDEFRTEITPEEYAAFAERQRGLSDTGEAALKDGELVSVDDYILKGAEILTAVMAGEEPPRRDPMKFRNADVSLDDAIKHNGGKLAMAKIPGLFELLRW